MTDNTPHDDIDTGKPIQELKELSEQPADSFFQRIHGSIQRRIAASEAVDFSLMGLFEAFLSIILIPLEWWESKKSESD